MKNLATLWALIAFLFALAPARAQFTPDFQGVTANPDGSLRAPLLFFKASSNHVWAIIGTSNYLADLAAKAGATNALLVNVGLTNATLYGSSAVVSGAGFNINAGGVLSGSSGSFILFPEVILTGNPFTAGPTSAASRLYVDITNEALVQNLAALRALPVDGSIQRRGYVRANTGSDNAIGPWVWDPTSTGPITAVCTDSTYLAPGSVGRWLHL